MEQSTIGDGVNVSKQDKVKPVLLPSEILNMSRLNLILKMPDQPSAKAKVKHKKDLLLKKYLKRIMRYLKI